VSTNAPWLAWLRRRLRTEERGFTLVELMVAQGIILVSLLSLAYTATIGFTDIALARQRQFANGLANGLIEQVRALPFDQLKTGLSTSDATIPTDAKITGAGCGTWQYRPITTAPLETVACGTNPVSVPLNPHRAIVFDPQRVTAYTRFVYVTVYNNDLTLNAYRITSVVEWTPPQRGAVRASVQAQTVAYSPLAGSGSCGTTANHPFPAPCQPFIYATAQLPAASIQIIPTPATFPGGVRGMDIEKASLYSVGQSVTAQAEQVTAVSGRVLTSGIDFKRTSTTLAVAGQQVVTSTADNDPSQPGGENDPLDSLTGSPPQTFSFTDDDFFGVSYSAGDTIRAMGTMTAGTSNPCGGETDGLACARSSGTAVSLNRARLEVNQGGVDLDEAVIASMAGGSAESTALAHRDLPAGLDGSMGARVTRVLPTVVLGGLPADFAPPAGWDTAAGLIRVSGYTATLEAQAGESSTSLPLAGAVTAGTVQFWNGTGYTTIPTSTLTSTVQTAFTVSFDQVRVMDGKDVRVTMVGTFLAGGLTISSTGTSLNRTRGEVRALPALIGSMTYALRIGPTTDSEQLQAALTLNVDLGTQIANASYTPAPGGA